MHIIGEGLTVNRFKAEPQLPPIDHIKVDYGSLSQRRFLQFTLENGGGLHVSLMRYSDARYSLGASGEGYSIEAADVDAWYAALGELIKQRDEE